jgi:hypothetical protein
MREDHSQSGKHVSGNAEYPANDAVAGVLMSDFFSLSY